MWIGFFLTLGGGIAVGLLGAISATATVFTYIGVALFLSLALDGLVTALERAGLARTGVVIILGSVALVACGLAATFLAPVLADQIGTLAREFIRFASEVAEAEWMTWLIANIPLEIDLNRALAELGEVLADPAKLSSVAGGLLAVGTGLLDGATGFIIVTVLTVYMTAQLPAIKEKAYAVVPRSRRAGVRVLGEEIALSVGRYVGGQLSLAGCNALFTLLLTTFAGHPAPLLISVIAFIGALIPVVGPVSAAAVAVVTTLPAGPVPALVTAALLLLYLQIEAYVLTPRVMSRAVAVPGGLVIIAALAGAALGGILGALVAVPVAAAGLILFNRVLLPRQEAR